ncbi:hypothetical protein Tco_0566966 [Tanacetum coccineum]
MSFVVFSTSNSYSSYSYYDFKDDECMTSEEIVESKLNNVGEVVDEDIQLMTVADHENVSMSIVVHMFSNLVKEQDGKRKRVNSEKYVKLFCFNGEHVGIEYDAKSADVGKENILDEYSKHLTDAEKSYKIVVDDDLQDQMKFAFHIEAHKESVYSLGTSSICAQLSNDISSMNKMIDELRGLPRSEVINKAIAFWINLLKDNEAKLELVTDLLEKQNQNIEKKYVLAYKFKLD